MGFRSAFNVSKGRAFEGIETAFLRELKKAKLGSAISNLGKKPPKTNWAEVDNGIKTNWAEVDNAIKHMKSVSSHPRVPNIVPDGMGGLRAEMRFNRLNMNHDLLSDSLYHQEAPLKALLREMHQPGPLRPGTRSIYDTLVPTLKSIRGHHLDVLAADPAFYGGAPRHMGINKQVVDELLALKWTKGAAQQIDMLRKYTVNEELVKQARAQLQYDELVKQAAAEDMLQKYAINVENGRRIGALLLGKGRKQSKTAREMISEHLKSNDTLLSLMIPMFREAGGGTRAGRQKLLRRIGAESRQRIQDIKTQTLADSIFGFGKVSMK